MKNIGMFVLGLFCFLGLSTVTFAESVDLDQGRCAVSIHVQRNHDSTVTLLAKPLGHAPFKYEWSTGETTEKINVKGGGEYCVTITDANDCKSRSCVKLDRTTGDKCEVHIVASLSRDSTLILTANARTLTRGVKYEWSNGETTQRIKVTKEGKYCVTITDSGGCQARDCFEVKLHSDRKCAVRIVRTTTLDGRTILVATPHGTPPFKFEWSNGETTQRILVEKSGMYCVVVKDSTGCESKACIDVRIRDHKRCAVFIKVGRPDSNGVSVLTALVKGKAPFKYEWSTGETTESIRVKEEKEYCVTVVDSTGCESKACIKFQIHKPRHCKAFIKAMRNANGTITLTVHVRGSKGPFKYSWSTGETTASIIVKPGAEYCVKVSNGGDCETSACFRLRRTIHRDTCGVKIEIKRDRLSSGVLLIAHTFGETPISYNWSNGETTQRIRVDKSGTYCVKIKDNEGCVAKACIDVRLLGGNGPQSIKVYPNPFNDVLYVEWKSDREQKVEYAIIGATGNRVLSGHWVEKGDALKRIDVSGLRSGIYSITLKTAGGIKSLTIYKK